MYNHKFRFESARAQYPSWVKKFHGLEGTRLLVWGIFGRIYAQIKIALPQNGLSKLRTLTVAD